jgi:hypothetical protein
MHPNKHDVCTSACKPDVRYHTGQRLSQPVLEDTQRVLRFVFENQSLAASQGKITSEYVRRIVDVNSVGQEAACVLWSIKESQ